MRTIVRDNLRAAVVPLRDVHFNDKKIYAYIHGDEFRVLIRVTHRELYHSETSFKFLWSSLMHVETRGFGSQTGYKSATEACNDFLRFDNNKEIYEFDSQVQLFKFLRGDT